MATGRLKVKAMDAALAAGIRIDDVTAFCREHGVSTRTFYRHRARIRSEGRWRERSGRPHTSPGRAGPDVDAWICKLRAELDPDNGADYIRDALQELRADLIQAGTPPVWRVPARSTINRVLSRHGLLELSPAKRPRSSWRRFSFAQPGDCYQIDATELTLPGGRSVVVFDVLDDCTRRLMACHAAPSQTAAAAVTAIGKAITTGGAPALVLSDNGAAFTLRLIKPDAGASRFARTVTAAGSRLIHSSAYHPQTCGKVERHHQTLKRWLATRPAHDTPTTLQALQRHLDAYREYYNHRRHSALPARATPEHAWHSAPSRGGPSRLPIQSDATIHNGPVTANGTITVGRHRIGVGNAYRGHPLTTIRDGTHATVYNHHGEPIGHAHLDPDKTYIPLTKIENL